MIMEKKGRFLSEGFKSWEIGFWEAWDFFFLLLFFQKEGERERESELIRG